VTHFHSKYKAKFSGTRSYSSIKSVLHGAGVVRATKQSGKRERMPLGGMMIHQDASTHKWGSGAALLNKLKYGYKVRPFSDSL
jgi:hypothetical protein